MLTGTSPGAFNWTNYSNTTTLSAPTTGDTAGITVWQTGSTASGSTNTITTDAFNGGSTLQLGGAFYAPYGSLNLSNNIKMSATAVIADMISATGSASLSVSASSSTSTTTTSTPIVLLQ